MKAERIVLAPIGLRITVDSDFIRFIKERISGRRIVEKDKIEVRMLGHTVPFFVVRTIPRKTEVEIVLATEVDILREPIETLLEEAPTDVNLLFRFEWLEHLKTRIGADDTKFSISGTDIIESDESLIIEQANQLADENFKNITILVRFIKNGFVLGALPWVKVSPFGNIMSIRPDVKIPPTMLSTSPRLPKEPVVSQMKRCFKIGVKECPKEIKFNPKKVVVAIPFSSEYGDLYKYAIRPAIEDTGLEPWKADEQINNIDIMCKICQAIQESGCLLADISSWNVNVMFELGLSYGLGKNAILIKNEKSEVPVDIRGIEYLGYNSIDELRKNLTLFLREVEIYQ